MTVLCAIGTPFSSHFTAWFPNTISDNSSSELELAPSESEPRSDWIASAIAPRAASDMLVPTIPSNDEVPLPQLLNAYGAGCQFFPGHQSWQYGTTAKPVGSTKLNGL